MAIFAAAGIGAGIGIFKDAVDGGDFNPLASGLEGGVNGATTSLNPLGGLMGMGETGITSGLFDGGDIGGDILDKIF